MKFLDQFSTLSIPHFGMVKLPHVNISAEQKRLYGVALNASNKDFLLALARAGCERLEYRIPTDKRQIYGNRAKTELAIFDELGFTDYVLLVWLVINKARELGVFIDYGRGSCAGSIIFWFLGITGVDPIDKQLLFERFVSRVRSKKQIINGEIYLQGDLIADADLNLGNGRDEIVQWLHEQYPDAVSKIVTHGTLTGKVLINHVYKCYGNASDAEAHQISGMLEMKYGVVDDIEDTYQKSEQFKEWADKHKNEYDICLRLRNLILQTGVHASGYVISPQPFDGFLPIQLSKNKEIISCYAMEDVCNFTIKLDLLGLVTNRIIREVLEKTGENLDAINLDSDPLIYDRFQDGKLLPYGLYQISADCAYSVTMAIKPKNVAELSDVNSIARPGALSYLSSYVENKSICPHPLFEPILKRTRNHCLYQEQMMQMAVAVGFTLDEAEILRKIVGKKQVEKAKEWKQKIYDRVKQSGLESNIADILWKILEDSASYSFNASHSYATSYLTALTVYLKYKYPQAFMCACLNATKDMPDEVEQRSFIIQELSQLGVTILPPDILKSGPIFQLEGNAIRYALSGVKGISDISMKKLSVFRSTKQFTSKLEMFDAAKTASLDMRILSGLILSGCLNWPNTARTKLLLEVQLYNLLSDNQKGKVKQFIDEANGDLIETLRLLTVKLNEKGKPLIPESQMNTLRRNYQPYYDLYLHNSRNEELASYMHEKLYLGYSFTSTLHKVYARKVVGLVEVSEIIKRGKAHAERLAKLPAGEKGGWVDPILFVVFIEECKMMLSQKDGTPYFKLNLYDDSGVIRGLLYGEERVESCKRANEGELPKVGDVAICEGTFAKDGTMMFLDTLIVQPPSIQTKRTSTKEIEV